jgi:YD repeat-containing protein
MNLGNYTFGPRKVITGMPLVLSPDGVRWADLNGNGATDLIYGDSAAAEGERIRMVDLGDILNGGSTPNVLVAISNGIGGVTLMGYVSSTQFSLEDSAAGRPWPDPMPFPVQVIGSVTNLDSLGHQYVTRFKYHDAYYEPVEKQFRGFASAEQFDVGDPTAPTLVSRSYFDTGRTFEPMKGKLLRLTAETEDGRVFTESFTAWSLPPRVLMTGTNGQTVSFVNAVGSTNLVLELGQGTPRRLESEMDYDQFGNQTRVANFGIVENGDRTAFDDERITLTEYAINTNAWILRTPKRQLVQDEDGSVIARSESYYDDETFSGNNFGSVTIGNLTLQRAWINPSNAMAFVRVARTKYDIYGNAIAVFDPLSDGTGNSSQGHFREMAYDSRFHSYPTRETIHVGNGKPPLVFQATYDEGLATMLSSTDFNGHTTTYGYDALARLTSVVKPYDTPAFPTSEYDYALAVPAGSGLVNFVETRQLDRTPGTGGGKRDHYLISRQFSDGLGRSLMTRSEAEPAPGQSTPRVVVSGAVLFNARQKPVRALNPFFTLQSGSLDELLAFENIEAPGWQGQFHENGSLVALNLVAAHQASTEYDATLRVVRATNPDGTRARTEYEPLITRGFDENDADANSPHFNTPMVSISDGLGRLVRVDELVRLNDDGTQADSVRTWTTRYLYDLNDALTRITDSQNNVKLMRYDGLKRKTFMNDPDCGISTNVYDEASNLIESVDAKGQRITYTYDGVNRMLSEDYHDENSPEFSYHRSPDVRYRYDEPVVSLDQGDGTRATARNVKGGIAYIEDTTGEEHTSFDDRGRIEWTVKRILDPELSPTLAPDSTKLVAYKTRFEFDSLDRVTRMIYPDNDEVTYRYNERSLLDGISGGPTGNILSGLGYLPSSQQEQINYGNGVRTTYAYDKRARLTTLDTRHSTLGTELVRFAYDFDNASNIRGISDQRATSLVPAADKRRNTQTFAYDNLYRLNGVQYNLPTPSPQNGGQINYRYDRLGNMLAQTSDIAHLEKGSSVTDLGTMNYGGPSGRSNRLGRQAGDPPGPHALTSTRNSELETRNFPYDANGNMTEIDGLACTWDFLNRLVAVENDSMRAEYRYDYTGRRIIKRVTRKPLPPAEASVGKSR